MQTLRHIVLVCVLTMSLLTSLMLSVILNLSLSVSPISPHVQLSLYSWISLLFSQGPPAHAASAGLLSNQILTVKVCSSTGRCSSSFIAITLVIFAFFLALFLKIWLHCFFFALLLFCMWTESWTTELLLLFFAEVLHLGCFTLRYSSQNCSLILSCSFLSHCCSISCLSLHPCWQMVFPH